MSVFFLIIQNNKKIIPKYLKVRDIVYIACFLTENLYILTHLCYKHTGKYSTTLPVHVWAALFQFASGLKEFVLRCQQGAFLLPDQCR